VDLWDHRVELKTDGGDHFQCISGSREAMEYMISSWPVKGGSQLAAARKVCLKAIEGEASAAEAEAAFVRAAEEAGILRR
jgi:hypothetical protein